MAYSEQYYDQRTKNQMWHVEAGIIRDLAGDTHRGTVLDLGCGTGDLLALLKPNLGVGVDYNEKAIQMAKSRWPAYTFQVGDATDPQSQQESVDCVVSMHFVEHLTDLEGALKAWHRVLKPCGRLIIVTPNRAFSHPEVFADPDHKHIYAGPELSIVLANAGFRVLRVLTVAPWGLRKTPLLWRFQGYLSRLRLPALPGLRWRGQTLAVSAAKEQVP
jgi:SAM-dependent methyltransferase